MNKMYGFEGEVKAKYTGNMVDLFTEVYNWLPLCHCINDRIAVMHGGLFSKVSKFNVCEISVPCCISIYPNGKLLKATKLPFLPSSHFFICEVQNTAFRK